MKHDSLQDSVLLSTKLKMPAPRKDYVIRRELFEQLKHCSEKQVVYIKGAAGTGKTTLLASFIKETGLKNVVWLSLDEANDNVFSFWHYFAAVTGNFLGDEREDILSLLRSNFEVSHMPSLLTLMINRLCGAENDYIVLDDMHYIKDKALINTLEFFLKSMPDNFHIFMLSRENPALYLGELAVSGRLLFIDGEKLQFSREEGLQFLKGTLKLTANDETIERMNEFAEGWIGGLQLVAAAGIMNRGFLHAAGSGIAADYLTREIFKLLTEEERYFLTATSICTYFDEELCAHLIDGVDFRGMLDRLMAKNLFITCIDEENNIYRYHNILGEYLKQQFSALPKSAQVKLHQSASLVLEARGEMDEALSHLFQAEDYEGAVRVLKAMDETIDTWVLIDRLPLDFLLTDLNLSIQCLMYSIGNMNLSRCREICKRFEEQYKGEEIVKALQYILLYTSDEYAAPITPELMTLEQIENLHLSPVSQSLLLFENANILLERKQYAQVEKFADRAIQTSSGANICADFFAYSAKAQMMEEVGRLNDSLAVYRQMEELLKSAVIMEVIGINYYVGIIGVYIKRMEVKNANAAFESCRSLMKKAAIPPFIIEFGYEYNLAEYELVMGDAASGAKIMSRLLASNNFNSVLQFGRLLLALSVNKMLEPAIAERFMKEYLLCGGKNTPLSSQLFYARLLWEKGETDKAMALVENILTFSRANQNRLRLVEADLLKIRMMILSGAKQKRTIDNLLCETVYYAWENRIMQPFYLEREIASPLIREMIKSADHTLSGGEKRFLQDVTDLCAGKAQESEKQVLSARELEVFCELAKGLTNPEIADRLCISLATVKTHIINIYGKLGVSSRMAALEEAKRRGVI